MELSGKGEDQNKPARVWAYCFQVLGILFKSEIKTHTGCIAARTLYPKHAVAQIRKKTPSRLAARCTGEDAQGSGVCVGPGGREEQNRPAWSWVCMQLSACEGPRLLTGC